MVRCGKRFTRLQLRPPVAAAGLLTPFGELGPAREATQMLGLCMGGADSAATAAPLEVYVGRDAATQEAENPQYLFGLNASIRA